MLATPTVLQSLIAAHLRRMLGDADVVAMLQELRCEAVLGPGKARKVDLTLYCGCGTRVLRRVRLGVGQCDLGRAQNNYFLRPIDAFYNTRKRGSSKMSGWP